MTVQPRAPDRSLAAEQSLLGAALLRADAFDAAVEAGVQAEHFAEPAHQMIWDAVAALSARRTPVDAITVADALGRHADDVGGLQYLNALTQGVPNPAHAAGYAGRVLQHALARKLVDVAGQVHDVAHGDAEPADKLDRIAAIVTAVERPGMQREPQTLAAAVAQRQGYWQALGEGSIVPGIPTGLPDFDGALGGGLKPGKVYVIGARPSVGKTSLAAEIAIAFGRANHPALFLSQEMGTGELVDRAMANIGRLSLAAISAGDLADHEYDALSRAADEASRLPVFIDDQPALSLLDIRAKARKVQRRAGLALLVLDYLQLTRDEGKAQHRHHQIEQISRGMKTLAKELQCAVVVLSQLTRNSMSRPDGEPTLADLKESGAIEEDADAVLLLHPRERLADGRQAVVGILAKNRQGKRGRIPLAFDGAHQTWHCADFDPSPRRPHTT